jgi:O-antigen ligase/polysaccharide polymerase Wzy-like membrane protein
MWLLTLAELFNSMAHQNNVINVLRIPLGGVPLGIMEVLTILLFCYAAFFGGNLQRAYPSRRLHPVYVVTIVLLALSFVTGSIQSFVGQIPLDFYLRMARELGTWPVFIYVGYRLMATPRTATYFAGLIIVCGLCMATVLLTHFSANTEQIEISDKYNSVRVVWYISAYCGMAAMLLAYGIFTKDRLIPTFIAAPLACFCLAGQFSPLHRVEWMGMGFCMAGLIFLLPREKRISTAIKGFFVIIALTGFLLLMVQVVSSVTQRDFGEFVNERLVSLLPTERQTSKEGKAWDTRLDSIWTELSIWESNPLLGRGFGIQEDLVARSKIVNYGAFHHNGWCSVLAQTGIIGFAGCMLVLWGLLIQGRKLVLYGPTKGMRLIGVLGVMCGLYEFAEVLGAMAWTVRFAMLSGVVCGMVYRCVDMMEAVAAEQRAREEAFAGYDQEYVPEEEPQHAPQVF